MDVFIYFLEVHVRVRAFGISRYLPKWLLYCDKASGEEDGAKAAFWNDETEPPLRCKSCPLLQVNHFPEYPLPHLDAERCLKYIFFTSLCINSTCSLQEVNPVDALSCTLNVYVCWHLGSRARCSMLLFASYTLGRVSLFRKKQQGTSAFFLLI